MSNTISVNTDKLNSWASVLNDAAEALQQVNSRLGSIDTGDFWWRKPKVSGSLHMRDTGASKSLGNAEQAIEALGELLKQYSRRIDSLATAVRNVGYKFESTENNVNRMIGGEGFGEAAGSVGRPGGEGFAQAEGTVPPPHGGAGKGFGAAEGFISKVENAWTITTEYWEDQLRKAVGIATMPARWTANAIQFYYNDYMNHGTTYKVVETIKAVGASGIAITGAAAAWIGTGVFSAATVGTGATVSVPAATLVSIYATNEVMNNVTDIKNIWSGNYDQVDKVNYLRDACVYSYGEIGDMMGNREMGENFGKGIYGTGEVINALSDISGGVDDIGKAVSSTGGARKLADTTGEVVSDVWNIANTADVGDFYKTARGVENFDTVKSLFGGAWNVGNGAYGVYKGANGYFED